LPELAAREALLNFRIVEHPEWKHRRDRACVVESRDLRGRQRHLRSGEIVFELSQRARADDRKRALGGDLGDGDFGGRNACVLGDRNQCVENSGAVGGVFLLEHPPAKPFAPTLLALAVFSGQHTTTKRRPSDNAEAKRLAGRQKLLLGRALDETMLDLKTGDGRNAAQFGDGHGPRHAPSGKVGEAAIKNLAGPGEVIEAPHDLFDWRDAIGYVRPVEVDPIGLEPLETRFNRRDSWTCGYCR
jgi:hypothetical protein